jgi:hypothetical protein
MKTLEEALRHSHDWAIDRIYFVYKKNMDDALSIQQEFSEWLDPDIPEHDIFSMQYIGE